MLDTQFPNSSIVFSPKAGQIRDPSWLMLEVCREFQRGTCLRSDTECKFAHPPKHVQVDNGKVVACFDATKNRCTRENCKYLHAPPHLQAELERNGKFNLVRIQLQGFRAPYLSSSNNHSASQYTPTLAHAQMPQFINLPWNSPPAAAYQPFLWQQESVAQATVNVANGEEKLEPTSPQQQSPPHVTETMLYNEPFPGSKIPVCTDFLNGKCEQTECPKAHPDSSISVDKSDNCVIVCIDNLSNRCTRDSCKYFHPPPHIKVNISSKLPLPNNAALSTDYTSVNQRVFNNYVQPPFSQYCRTPYNYNLYVHNNLFQGMPINFVYPEFSNSLMMPDSNVISQQNGIFGLSPGIGHNPSFFNPNPTMGCVTW